MIRLELHYYGRVQGVGFRFWVQSQATKAKVTGWVRNEYDGSVTVEAQGTSSQIEMFLYGVQNGHRYIRIDKVTKKIISVDPKENKFGVRY